MTDDLDPGRLDAYLARYADTLTRRDARAAAALWSTPGTIVDDVRSGALDTREAMSAGLEQSYPLYDRLGLASVGHELVEHRRLSARLVLVRVRWRFLDAAGAQLTDADSWYLLRDDPDEGLLACVCVETDSAAKLQQLAAARGVDLGQA
jgi:hypothetical protein